MISPAFVEPRAYASPADRDPFSAGWDKYVDPMAATKQLPADSPVKENVNFPLKLMGVLSDANGQRLAMIGSEVYGVGSSLKVPDSNELWKVNSIESESVILTRNNLRAIVKIADDYNDSNNVTKDNSETQGQKESAK
jgi:Tfp pilus assembly protein PilP